MSTVLYKFVSAASDFAWSILDSSVEVEESDNEATILRGNPSEKKSQKTKSTAQEFPYWQFIPTTAGKVIPDGAQVTWQGMCFTESSAKATTSNSSILLTITLAKPKTLLCSDSFLIADVAQISLHTYTTHGDKQITWTLPSNLTSADLWDLHTNGLRIFMFAEEITTIAVSVTDTALLFEPLATKAVGESAAARNMEFLSKYAHIPMTKRNITDVKLNASDINSGDFFGVVRLDGLDPMLGWAMGSTTGHTTIALRDANTGVLYVCESTAKSSYWDTNGIQCTPYDTWFDKAKAASYNVVHLPLAPEYRAAFNETAAWNWFRTVEGLDYGYETLLWGWVDTVSDNYPCLPPDFNRCLSWDIINVLFPVGSKIVTQFTMLWKQAFNHRLGTSDLEFADMMQVATSQGIEVDTIPTLIEQDSWTYATTRNGQPAVGPSMVCCVFVCTMWKVSGMFGALGDQINCEELTNWDDYSMLVFDKDYVRPQACVEADPTNEVCQILGEYTLNLNNYNSKAPYPHIAEHCPSLAPNYNKPADC